MVKKSDPMARQGYHHGNLREALVLAARKLIAERGPTGFTLIEAARAAGVSAAAPYRHFKDRTALVAEVAQRGFVAFGQRMREAATQASAGETSFSSMGETYLAFAREEPGYYAAMFQGGLQGEPATQAADATFHGLSSAVAGAAQRLKAEGQGEVPDTDMLAYYVWALSHGIATLAAVGFLPDRKPKPSPDELLKTGVSALMRGSLVPKA